MSKFPPNKNLSAEGRTHRSPRELPDMDGKHYTAIKHCSTGKTCIENRKAGNAWEATLRPSGQIEIAHQDGSQSNYIPGECNIEAGSITTTSKHAIDIHSGGGLNIKTKQGGVIDITGDGDVTIGGNMVINVLGGGIINTQGNATINSKGNLNVDGAAINIRSAGDITIGAGGAVNIQGGGGVHFQKDGAGVSGYRMGEAGTGEVE